MIRREPLRPVDSSLRIFLCGRGRLASAAAISSGVRRGAPCHQRGPRLLPARPGRGARNRRSRTPRGASSAAARRQERHSLRPGGREEPASSATRRGRPHPRVERLGPARQAGHRRRPPSARGELQLGPVLARQSGGTGRGRGPPGRRTGDASIEDYFARSRSMSTAEACSRLQRWLLDPLGRLIARLAEAISRVIASRTRRQASRDSFMSALAPRRAVGAGVERKRPWTHEAVSIASLPSP